MHHHVSSIIAYYHYFNNLPVLLEKLIFSPHYFQYQYEVVWPHINIMVYHVQESQTALDQLVPGMH